MSNRRGTHRYELSLPVVVQNDDPTGAQKRNGKTRDISTRGVYFLMDEDLAPGSSLDLTLTLPPEVTQGLSVLVRAQGRVIRTEKKQDNGHIRIGVAAAIEKYEIVRAESPN